MSFLDEYRYLGNFSAVDPAYSKDMYCDDCMTRWTGCWDNFMCPECGGGELPGKLFFEAADAREKAKEEAGK